MTRADYLDWKTADSSPNQADEAPDLGKHTESGKEKDSLKNKLLPKDKFCLTVEEAAAYFEIGEKKIRLLAEAHRDDGIFTRHGVKVLVLRTAFENFLLQTSDI